MVRLYKANCPACHRGFNSLDKASARNWREQHICEPRAGEPESFADAYYKRQAEVSGP